MKVNVKPVYTAPPKQPVFDDLRLGELFAYNDSIDPIPHKVFMKIDTSKAWDFKANGAFSIDISCKIRRATGEVNVQMID